MEITFTRTGGRDDWVSVMRDDGSPLRWPWPAVGPQLPHDLVHFVVETHLRISWGFWGRVAAGADFGSLSQLADRLAAGEQPADASGGAELAQVECIVRAVWPPDDPVTDEELLDQVEAWCRQRRIPPPETLCAQTLERLRARLRAVEEQWRTLAAGQSLVLSYRP
ncbi:MAG: hypothetical protein HY241_07680 [Actinobacteria bacterium]|nr:hypothetical protein [Actinomycetota bacterium]